MVRSAWLLVLCVLVVAGTAAAQVRGPELDETDPTNDTAILAPDGSTIAEDGQTRESDILGVRVSALDSGILVSLQISEPAWTNTDDPTTYRHAYVYFTYGGTNYRLDFHDVFGGACLERQIPGTASFDEGHAYCVEKRLVGDWLEATIESERLTDSSGGKLLHPALISDVWAESRQDYLLLVREIGFASIVDRAPEMGYWSGIETPIPPGSGTIQVTTNNARRSSNGGPDLFLYNVTVRNISNQPFSGRIHATELPLGWTITYPLQITVPAGSTTAFPVVVSTSSAHEHGTSTEFEVFVAGDTGTGSVPLSVHFLDIPNPAGHHPRLYLHSQQYDVPGVGPFVQPWMNTLREDSAAGEVAVPSTFNQGTRLAETSVWAFQVPLALGLDFDVNKVVTSKITLQSETPLPGQAFRQRLMYCNPADGTQFRTRELYCNGSWTALAESPWMTIDFAGTPVAIEQDLPLVPAADFIRYQPGSSLALFVESQNHWLTTTQVTVDPSQGEMRLPLFEYQDPDALSFRDRNLQLETSTPTLTANPGQTALFEVFVRTPGKLTFTTALNGHNSDWAFVQADDARFIVTVQVPADAEPLDYADMYLVVQDSNGETAVQRLRLEVVSEPVEQAIVRPVATKEAPSAPLGAMLLAGMVALVVRRKRQF